MNIIRKKDALNFFLISLSYFHSFSLYYFKFKKKTMKTTKINICFKRVSYGWNYQLQLFISGTDLGFINEASSKVYSKTYYLLCNTILLNCEYNCKYSRNNQMFSLILNKTTAFYESCCKHKYFVQVLQQQDLQL